MMINEGKEQTGSSRIIINNKQNNKSKIKLASEIMGGTNF